MTQIVTSDQFVAGIISVLALQDKRKFILTDAELDQKFEKAYVDLIECEEQLGITSNFSFYVDPLHGDSVCLRDTLLGAKENELIALNNPTFRTFDIKLDQRRAERYLQKSPMPRTFLEDIVAKHFA
jgi:hypothetical protein